MFLHILCLFIHACKVFVQPAACQQIKINKLLIRKCTDADFDISDDEPV